MDRPSAALSGVTAKRWRGGRKGAGAAAGGPPAPVPRGVAARIVAAWREPRRIAAAERADGPDEPRLLAYLLGGCLLLGLARLPVQLREAAAGEGPVAGANPTLLIVANAATMLFFVPLFLYAVAALLRALLALVGGTGDWRETRLAVFWSLLAAGPGFLLGYGIASLLTAAGAGAIAFIPRLAADLGWLRLWSAGLAEAHGFRSEWPLFAGMVALGLTFWLLG